jgi:hypothetical protein
MPGVAGVTVVIMLVCFFIFARKAAGALRARYSLRPLISEGELSWQNSDASRRGNIKLRRMNANLRYFTSALRPVYAKASPGHDGGPPKF